ncbi:hypothetical protein [Sandarakinorhabdus sp. DWP1-3-1]|uniref:hypothetical protein n=1 Tax=Sandarakinorhabdus sp. DWP1-3-1 TaxID=2804627 RepID=UPI003CE7DE79
MDDSFATEKYMPLSADEIQKRFEDRARVPSSEAARQLLAAGHRVAYRYRDTPLDRVLLRYPDGSISSIGPDGVEELVSGPDPFKPLS